MKTKKEIKLRNEPQVQVDFPFNEFKTKEGWLIEVQKNWSQFRRAFNESGIKSGSYFYPLTVSRWLDDFNLMDKLMNDYSAGSSYDQTGKSVYPMSIYKELVAK